MARPQKIGLDYFPLDNNISDDDKVFYIESEHGIVGFGVYIKLLTRIYDNGYYIEWDKFRQKVLARKVNVDINILLDVVNSCIECGLFNKKILEDHNILTSKAIQKRYFEATSRRKSVEVLSEYCLININDYNNIKLKGINVDINPQSDVDNDNSCKHDVDINPQRKEEDSKEENSKEKDNQKNIQLFDYWQNKPHLHEHSGIGKQVKKQLDNLPLKEVENVKLAIDRYEKALVDDNYYYNNVWTLDKFIKQSNGYTEWLDDGARWVDYNSRNKIKEKPIANRCGVKQADVL